MQETNVSIPQLYRIRNPFVGCWTANGWITCSSFMGCGDRCVTFIKQYQTTNQSHSRKLFAKSQIQPQTKGRPRCGASVVCGLRYVTTNAHSSQGKSQLYISEDNEAVIKMIIKSRVSSPRELRKVPRKSCETETNEFGVKEPPESEEKVFRKI